ncbi:hypothetical protein PM10SUCC1_32570 [Propionigenium maris DSM 9537]|uniref:Uncharacterized protein n=1 Tax=Propionigenium maris DSM 9537 TaxID=1123000 RepID=A0A9W6GMD4_9FUSO|nr:hypothetical protein [Propionigenium maris]GLI57743.1 hypothetical protein PM10SUCC1_32570 [Propionigenium maris DSM 9537]
MQLAKGELIHDIKDRFRFSLTELRKGLMDFELDLVYQAYPKLSKKEIDNI